MQLAISPTDFLTSITAVSTFSGKRAIYVVAFWTLPCKRPFVITVRNTRNKQACTIAMNGISYHPGIPVLKINPSRRNCYLSSLDIYFFA